MTHRVLHTSDWHLGQNFHGMSRQKEHQSFLLWLRQTLAEYQVQTLVVAGDIFDVSNPPASAIKDLFEFLVATRRDLPKLNMVLTGGNHDSAIRLESNAPILNELNIYMIGAIPRSIYGEFHYEAMCIPLNGENGETQAWCGAMPFIRFSDMVGSASFQEQVHHHYRNLYSALQRKNETNLPVIVTGHLNVAGGVLSPESERPIMLGNLEGISTSTFPDFIDYVALGHLHKPQFSAEPKINYSGSPLAFAMPEAKNEQSVSLVDLGPNATQVRRIAIPRSVAFLQVPEQPKNWDEVVDCLAALPERDERESEHLLPYCQVNIMLDGPIPGLKRLVEGHLTDKAVRLVSVKTHRPEQGEPPEWHGQKVQELQPEQAFFNLYQQRYDVPPPKDLMSLFQTLAQKVGED